MAGWIRYLMVLAVVAMAPLQAQEDRSGAEPAAEEAPPKRSRLFERVEARLAQIDVTVIGSPEVVQSLTAEDFEVRIGFKRIREFELDRFCSQPEAASDVRETTADVPELRSKPACYLLYFDQPHLTLGGRNRAMGLARELIRDLVRDGSRAMIVSNARRLATVSGLTDDADALLESLSRLERDRGQWDFYGQQEVGRVADVVETLNEFDNVNLAVARARTYQQEERWRAQTSLRRLSMVLGRLTGIEPPKAVIYFADTMRSNAGEHYMSFFGTRVHETNSTLAKMSADSLTANLAFDQVVNQASAQGIRFYSVLAQGLAAHLDTALPTPGASALAGRNPPTSRIRVRDVETTLGNFASETGGYAFLHGQKAERIADRMQADASCIYLISFDPAGYSKDSPHRVVVKVDRPGVEVRSRGRLVLQSESKKLKARLLGAFTAPGALDQPFGVRSHLIPTSYQQGAYRALVQVSVPGTPFSGTTWELGASLVSRDKVRSEASGQVSVSGPGVPVILESEIKFSPGPFEIVSVAHETRTDTVVSGHNEASWPDPDHEPATVGAIALLQPERGVFLRDGQVRTSGSVARPAGEPVRNDRPLAFVGLVCRGRGKKKTLEVRRSIVGQSSVEFAPLNFELDKERCAQVRDLVPADTLGTGVYLYELLVLHKGQLVGRGEREFAEVGNE